MGPAVSAPDSGKRPHLPRALIAGLLLLTVLVALLVRLDRLADLHYWFDESFSIQMAQFPLSEMLVRCAADTHPPLFFLCLKGWLALFGNAEWPTRLFSTLWSLGAVGCAFGFTYEGLRHSVESSGSRANACLAATLAGLCVALSPLHISWAQQVRMYAPVTCLSLLSTWLLWRALQHPERTFRWLSFAVVEVVALYTHVTLWFVVAAHVLALGVIIFQQRREQPLQRLLLRRSLLTMSLVGLAGFPWFLVIREQQARVQDDFWIRPLDWDLLGEAFVQCFTVFQRPVSDPNAGLWIAQGLLVALVFVAAGRRSLDLLIALTAGMPFVLLITVSLLTENIVNARYFIAGHALVCVAVALLIARIPWWALKLPMAVCIVGLLGTLVSDYREWRTVAAQGEGIPGILSRWQEHRGDGEPLVFSNPMFYSTARVYAGTSGEMRIFGAEAEYPFFVGTAITSDEEYLPSEKIDASRWETIWVCDYGHRERFLQPVQLGNGWQLIMETSTKDYSGTFFLRRYDRKLLPDRHTVETVDSKSTSF